MVSAAGGATAARPLACRVTAEASGALRREDLVAEFLPAEDFGDDVSVAELSDAEAESVPVSANAMAVPPTIAAPRLSVTAPAPSHAYGWRRLFLARLQVAFDMCPGPL
ncbi:MAG: hypothetical protein KDB71_17515 [Mycobacterium sp.]|nr:hypothetical protein [Mycobacterium sp.]